MSAESLAADARALDTADPLAEQRQAFDLPPACVYLDGNSLGALPRSVAPAVQDLVARQWGQDLIASWNRHHWIDLPVRVGERIAPLLGAAPGQTICTDSISVNLFKLLTTALRLRPERREILAVEGDFPTDSYIAQGLTRLLGEERCVLRRVPAAQLRDALGEDTAVLMLTQVNYRSGELYPMAELTRAAHEAGALALWDLAHSAGVVPMCLDDWSVDMAVGCGYKYLNGGPGAPGFLYLNARHHALAEQPLSGWLGHRLAFDFAPDYAPADGVLRYLAGTPPIISLTALNAALDVYDGVSVAALRAKSLQLSEFFLRGLTQLNLGDALRCCTPAAHDRRGSQISLAHPEAWGISQALIEAGVIVDFRAPDVLRFGFAPLYTRFVDLAEALRVLHGVMHDGRYRDPRYANRPTVT